MGKQRDFYKEAAGEYAFQEKARRVHGVIPAVKKGSIKRAEDIFNYAERNCIQTNRDLKVVWPTFLMLTGPNRITDQEWKKVIAKTFLSIHGATYLKSNTIGQVTREKDDIVRKHRSTMKF